MKGPGVWGNSEGVSISTTIVHSYFSLHILCLLTGVRVWSYIYYHFLARSNPVSIS